MVNEEFYEDIKYRKQLAGQARHRKGSRGGRKCNLPSDNLTRKQWEERCGKLETYQLGSPMSWSDFRGMPQSKKEEYIRILGDRYNVNASAMCRMFNISPGYFSKYIKTEGLDVCSSFSSRMSKDEKEAFNKFCSGHIACCTENEDETAADDAQERAEEPRKPSYTMDGVTIRFAGKIDLGAVYNSMKSILGDAPDGALEITWSRT